MRLFRKIFKQKGTSNYEVMAPQIILGVKMDKLTDLFTIIQAIPYRCRAKSHTTSFLNIPYANCSQKRELLKKELALNGHETRCLDGIFDWRDLPIPAEILNILKKSGTLQKHHLLEVQVDENYIKVDPTWNLELEAKGFPVTKNWDGKSDTKQITDGRVIFYYSQNQSVKLPYFSEERENFARELNIWLGWSSNI